MRVRARHRVVVLGGAALDAQVVAHEGLHLVRVSVRVRVRVRIGVKVRVGVGVTVRVRVGATSRLDEGPHIRRSSRERLVVRIVFGVHVKLDAGPRPEGDRRDLRCRVGGWS